MLTVKRFRIRGPYTAVAMVAALGAAFVFVTGGAATRATLGPTVGTGCSANGKIDGRGATFQTRAQAAFANGFEADICGVQTDSPADESTYTNPSYVQAFPNLNMVQYNMYDGVPGGVLKVIDGSGAGLNAIACRADLFAGTDKPYNQAQLTGEDAAPSPANTAVLGTGATCTSKGLANTLNGGTANPAFVPPYEPLGATGTTVGGYPNSADTAGNLMSFPVAGSAVAIGVNFNGTAGCPTTVKLTGQMIADLFGGDILNWTDARLQELVNGANPNPGLATCNVSVTRVVRLDDSGTTQIFKNYLQFIDGSRLGETNDASSHSDPAPCESALTWTTLQGRSPNYDWPGFDHILPTSPAPDGSTKNGAAATASCSAIDTGDVNGNNGVLDVCEGGTAGTVAIAGAICYADLPDEQAFTCAVGSPPGPGCHALVTPTVLNSAGTTFRSPIAGVAQANCTYSAVVGPGGGTTGTVGLNPTDTWATDNSLGNYGNVAASSPAYPICGITFDLVMSGLSAAGQTIYADATANQIRTLYSYFTYIESSVGQAQLPSLFYAPLPASLYNNVYTGFQANF
jgi:ABC-type phosphate transport system substrate-binding protein